MSTRIVNIRQIVTPVGHGALSGDEMRQVSVRENAEIVIDGELITAIEPAGAHVPGDTLLDAHGGVAIPGLIDAHTHCSASHGSVRENRESEHDVAWAVRAFRRLLREGTTTVEIKCCGRPGLEDGRAALTLLQHLMRGQPLRVVPTFLACCPDGVERDEGVSSLIRETIPAIRRSHLAIFCDALCGEHGYAVSEARTILRAARGAGLRSKLHLDGTADRTGTRLAAELEVASVDHVDAGTPAEMKALQSAAVVPVVLPIPALLEDRPYPTGRALIDAGLPISVASNHTFVGKEGGSLWTAAALAVRKMGLDPAEALTAMTLNAAAALESADRIGSIEAGKIADVVILDVEDYRDAIGTLGPIPVRIVVAKGGVARGASP